MISASTIAATSPYEQSSSLQFRFAYEPSYFYHMMRCTDANQRLWHVQQCNTLDATLWSRLYSATPACKLHGLHKACVDLYFRYRRQNNLAMI